MGMITVDMAFVESSVGDEVIKDAEEEDDPPPAIVVMSFDEEREVG